MIAYLLLAIAFGFVLTCLTARAKKLSGYSALVCMLLFNAVIFQVAVKAFKGSSPLRIDKPLFSIPAIGAHLVITVDKLSAIFLVLIGLISLLATLYSIRYMESYKRENLIRFYPFLILFVAGMIGVVCVADLFFFFVFWELMTLASYVLVVFEREDAVVLRAGFKYFLMTHVATALMFIAGVVLRSRTDSFAFTSIEKAMAAMAGTTPVAFHLVIALFFIGFATKAGVYPFGSWLPDAHPAAPSGVSAILSGIMIKMGFYGMLRMFFYWIPIADLKLEIWGVVIATFGVVSIVTGTLGALVQEDYKRLFAYSSIGQVGYMLMAIGVGITFMKSYPTMAFIALIAGILHLFHHALFKSLLFFNAGSILYRTRTRNLNEIGGLSRILPVTTVTAMVASMSIIGLPLFSGFASKFLIYEVTMIGGVRFPLYIFYGVLAVFLSVLTMAYCIKFMSISFFGTIPVKLGDKLEKKEVPLTMTIPQVAISILCVVFGVIPLTPMFFIHASLSDSKLGFILPSFSSLFGSGRNGISLLQDGNTFGAFKPVLICLVFALCLALATFIFKSAGAVKRNVPVWYCGEEYNDDHVRYKASGYYLSITRLFKRWFIPHGRVFALKKPERVYRALDFDTLFYYPFARWMIQLIGKLRKTHVGIPQVYMLWQAMGIFLVILILFLFAR